MGVVATIQLSKDKFAMDVDLNLPDRGVVGVFGASGSGKTTLLRAIAGLERGRNNTVMLGNEVWESGDVWRMPHQREIGYVFQDTRLFSHLNVEENLRFASIRAVPKYDWCTFEKVVEWLGLGPLLLRTVNALSGGEAQRVAIGRALLSHPKLVLMDEPLTALDTNSKVRMMKVLREIKLKMEVPFIYVTHSVDEIAELADHVLVMDKGRVDHLGTVQSTFGKVEGPFSKQRITETILVGRLVTTNRDTSLDRVEVEGAQWMIPRSNQENGEVRLRIHAKHVHLSLERPNGTSALNVFDATVEGWVKWGAFEVLVQLKVGRSMLLSLCSKHSFDLLQLKLGKCVFVEVNASNASLTD